MSDVAESPPPAPPVVPGSQPATVAPADERGSYGRPLVYVIVAALALSLAWTALSAIQAGRNVQHPPPEVPPVQAGAAPAAQP